MFTHVVSFLQLSYLTLYKCSKLSDTSVQHLSLGSFPNLKALFLEGKFRKFDEVLVENLSRAFPNLEKLHFRRFDVSPSALQLLVSSFRTLTTVRLSNCHKVSNMLLEQISKSNFSQQLETLDLNGCTKVTLTEIRELLRACKSLRTVSLVGCSGVSAVESERLREEWKEINVHISRFNENVNH